jgi:hypothetical protein
MAVDNKKQKPMKERLRTRKKKKMQEAKQIKQDESCVWLLTWRQL